MIFDRLKRFYRAGLNAERLALESGGRVHKIEHKLHDLERLAQDQLILQLRQAGLPQAFSLKTDHPVAIHSHDHVYPWGTMNDATRHPRFVRACEVLFPNDKHLNALDLGCAGGGLVFDFLMRGHRAMGLEGSDHSLLAQRAFWRLVPDHLKTCDITKPFTVDGQFHVISAWEVLEHIEEADIGALFDNIRNHLRDDGVFAASVATYHDVNEDGVDYHRTVQPREWWVAKFAAHSLVEIDPSPFGFADNARGTSNGPMDWDAQRDPHLGFHICVRKKG